MINKSKIQRQTLKKKKWAKKECIRKKIEDIIKNGFSDTMMEISDAKERIALGKWSCRGDLEKDCGRNQEE